MSPPSPETPESSIRHVLDGIDPLHPDWDTIIRRTLDFFHSEMVTVHRLDAATGTLHLIAPTAGLSGPLLDTIKAIPLGKGMAGVAALERRPVTACNIQVEAGTGAIRPGARQSGMKGALVVPIEADGKVIGTLGIGTSRDEEYGAEAVAALSALATRIGGMLTRT